jgi:hypothetical protein
MVCHLSRVSGFAGWFTTDFNGSADAPLNAPTTLSTGPEAGYTHWGQQVRPRCACHCPRTRVLSACRHQDRGLI